MKRFIILTLLVLLVSSVLFGVANSVQSKRIGVQAGVGTTLFVNVSPIASQSQAYIMGMPFNVDDTLVSYGYNRNGRQVASWSLLTNVPFSIKVEAADLKHGTEYTLPYYLCFVYSLSYYAVDAANPTARERAFVIKSEGNTDTATPPAYSNVLSDEEYYSIHNSGVSFNLISDVSYESRFVGTLDGLIYFKFGSATQSSSSGGQGLLDKAPGGEYSALVTVTVEAEV